MASILLRSRSCVVRKSMKNKYIDPITSSTAYYKLICGRHLHHIPPPIRPAFQNSRNHLIFSVPSHRRGLWCPPLLHTSSPTPRGSRRHQGPRSTQVHIPSSHRPFQEYPPRRCEWSRAARDYLSSSLLPYPSLC